MSHPNIRPAQEADLARIAEILVFNYRMNFYPIFRDDGFYFAELQVPNQMRSFEAFLPLLYVYDDGVVKGFAMVEDGELRRLFVEPVLQNRGIGAALLTYAVEAHGVNRLWALEKNPRAIRFYERYGFRLTEEKRAEAGTSEYLVRMVRK